MTMYKVRQRKIIWLTLGLALVLMMGFSFLELRRLFAWPFMPLKELRLVPHSLMNMVTFYSGLAFEFIVPMMVLQAVSIATPTLDLPTISRQDRGHYFKRVQAKAIKITLIFSGVLVVLTTIAALIADPYTVTFKTLGMFLLWIGIVFLVTSVSFLLNCELWQLLTYLLRSKEGAVIAVFGISAALHFLPRIPKVNWLNWTTKLSLGDALYVQGTQAYQDRNFVIEASAARDLLGNIALVLILALVFGVCSYFIWRIRDYL